MAEICYNCFHEKDAPGACPYCQYDGAADKGRFPAALPAGMTLAEHYTVGRVLGQGGFGITYIAKNEKNGKLVAIKEYFPDSMASRTSDHSVSAHSGERGESFRYGLGCFLEEAKTLAAFIGNPNIVRVYRYFEENGTAYFVMEYVEGVSLKDYLKRRGGKISFAEAKRILIPAMDALAAVHSKGIVHRDISPDNILIKKDGTVKLLDFGAARYSIGDMSRSLDVVLKHGYAPREQYTRRGRQGPFTDIYSLAATFYRALTGVVPQESIDRLDNDELITPMAYCPDLTPQADFALYHALSVQPADRFQSMAQFKNALLSQTPMNQDTLFKKMPNGSYVNAYASAAASARAAVPYQNTAPSYQNAPYAAQPAKPAAYAAPPQKPAQYQAPAQNPAPYQAPAQNYYQQPAAPAASPYAAPQNEAKKPFSPIKIMLISFGASAVVMGIVALIVALAT